MLTLQTMAHYFELIISLCSHLLTFQTGFPCSYLTPITPSLCKGERSHTFKIFAATVKMVQEPMFYKYYTIKQLVLLLL